MPEVHSGTLWTTTDGRLGVVRIVNYTRIRRSAPNVTAFVYAGYKWFEDHTDDVERWSVKALEQTRGKRLQKLVAPAAEAARSAARWVKSNNDAKDGPKKLNKG